MTGNDSKVNSWRQFGAAILQGLGAGVLLLGAFVGGYLYHAHRAAPASTASFDLLQETETLLRDHFLYDLPNDADLVHSAAKGMVASLEDPYTYFVEPQTAELDENGLAGSFGGIGAEIGVDEAGHYVIMDVYRNNPAYEAGLQAGDIIAAVDGVEVDVESVDTNALLAAIRGDIGEPLTMTIQRGDEVFDVEIIRAEVLIPSVFWRVLEEDDRVGYIQIIRFTNRSPEEVSQAIDELSAEGVEAYIIDLQNNGGGLVDSAVDVAGNFLNGGVVLYETRNNGENRTFNASRGGKALDKPVVVLVNGGTASASEILAGAFQDRARATLVGEQTYGKGSVQLILTLSDDSSLHVTTAEWFTPERNRIQDQGLEPDIPVTADEQNAHAALSAALEYLNSELSVAEAARGQN